ncbi:MAG TPA: thermosome subunit alpha [Candidatus Nitrosotenuis sp.]
MANLEKIIPEDLRYTKSDKSRRYNLLGARLTADLVKTSLGPRGLEKMYIDVLGDATVTKDGAAFLRKVDLFHPAAKAVIEAANSVDNAVGDGTITVTVLIGALIQKAEELLDLGIPAPVIIQGYERGLEISLETLYNIAKTKNNSDAAVLENLALTCLRSKAISNIADEDTIAKLIVKAVSTISDFKNNKIEHDDIKIEEKPGSADKTTLIRGMVVDKTIDNSQMPKNIQNAKILLLDDELDNQTTKTESEIIITSVGQREVFLQKKSEEIKNKVSMIMDSGANVVFSRKGINLRAQEQLLKAGIASVRRVKENDLHWLSKATGAKIVSLDEVSKDMLGFAGKVYEEFVGDDKMVFVERCINPKAVTILLRSQSKRYLDEFHRSVLDAIHVLVDFIVKPQIVVGGGSTEALISKKIRQVAYTIEGKEQLVVAKFAEALEEIPLTIARNSGMSVTDVYSQLRSKVDQISLENISKWYGIDAIERKVQDLSTKNVIEPMVVKEQILKTASEVVQMLLRVDDIFEKKPLDNTHTHADGTTHSHAGGSEKHDHDAMGKIQRPMHHYY